VSLYESDGVNDENILREKAREAIASGKLPMRKAHRALGGLGTGRTCALCGGLLTPTQMEIEIELNPQGSAHGLPRRADDRRQDTLSRGVQPGGAWQCRSACPERNRLHVRSPHLEPRHPSLISVAPEGEAVAFSPARPPAPSRCRRTRGTPRHGRHGRWRDRPSGYRSGGPSSGCARPFCRP
jgi:hypothetical protein